MKTLNEMPSESSVLFPETLTHGTICSIEGRLCRVSARGTPTFLCIDTKNDEIIGFDIDLKPVRRENRAWLEPAR